MNLDFWEIIISIILAMASWFIVHYFATKRDVENKRRDISLEHLINAYRVLTNEISHREPNSDRRVLLENLLSDIQLFGSIDQVNLARKLADEIAQNGSFELDPLINNLRDDLRHKLKLREVQGNVKWLRFED